MLGQRKSLYDACIALISFKRLAFMDLPKRKDVIASTLFQIVCLITPSVTPYQKLLWYIKQSFWWWSYHQAHHWFCGWWKTLAAVNVEEQNLLFVALEVDSSEVINYFIVGNRIKEFANDTKELYKVILQWGWKCTRILENWANCWKVLQIWETFLIKQWLKNFAKFGDNSGQRFWHMTRILSRLLASIELRFLIGLENS